MILDNFNKDVMLDRDMVWLIDEFELSSFEKLVSKIKETAGTKASIPFSALAERNPPELGRIAQFACINLLQNRIRDMFPEKDPFTDEFEWLDLYVKDPPLYQEGEINFAIASEDFKQLDSYLTTRDLGTCKYTLYQLHQRGIQSPLLVDALIDCLQIPIIPHITAKLLLPYHEPRAIPGLIWLIKYSPGKQHITEFSDTLAAIGQPAVKPIANAYRTFHMFYEQLNVPGAPWQNRVHDLVYGSPLFPAVQQLADGMDSLNNALRGINDPRAISELRLLAKEPIPRMCEAAKLAIASIEKKY